MVLVGELGGIIYSFQTMIILVCSDLQKCGMIGENCLECLVHIESFL